MDNVCLLRLIPKQTENLTTLSRSTPNHEKKLTIIRP